MSYDITGQAKITDPCVGALNAAYASATNPGLSLRTAVIHENRRDNDDEDIESGS
jgi:hypothetical protein